MGEGDEQPSRERHNYNFGHIHVGRGSSSLPAAASEHLCLLNLNTLSKHSEMNPNGKRPRLDTKQSAAGLTPRQLEKMREN